jgi:hypothetical protein
MIERYHIKERNDITQPREEKRKTNRGIDPNKYPGQKIRHKILLIIRKSYAKSLFMQSYTKSYYKIHPRSYSSIIRRVCLSSIASQH